MQLTRMIAALTFLSVAGAAHAGDWPVIKNNQIDDFTVAGESVPDTAQRTPTAQPDRTNVPDCCAGMQANATPSVSGAEHFDGESKG
jgi:hypothetical protein